MFNVEPEKVVKLDIVSIQVLQYIHKPNKNPKRSPYVEGKYVARLCHQIFVILVAHTKNLCNEIQYMDCMIKLMRR